MGEIPKVEDNSFIKAIFFCVKLDNLKSEVKMCCHSSTGTVFHGHFQEAGTNQDSEVAVEDLRQGIKTDTGELCRTSSRHPPDTGM